MIVTLLTDFGDRDVYVGAMKGQILSRDQRIRIVDLTHAVPPQAIRTASYLLTIVFRDFPPGTIHTVVVDPGIGSARAPIACSAGGYRFVGPDNGVLGWALEECGDAEVRRIDNPLLLRPDRSTTLHGPDVFAPAAAALASGMDFADLGPRFDEWDRGPRMLAGPGADGSIDVEVLHVDHFGNLILNVPSERMAENLSAWMLEIGGDRVDDVRRFFADGIGAAPFLYRGSTGFVEVGVNGGSAADVMRAGVGDRGILRLRTEEL